MTNKRITELDGLRGLAIFLVLVYHYASFNTTRHSLGYYLSLPVQVMWTGVDLFFILSGFLIGGILIDHKGSPQYFSTFYFRRFHRILPIYYILIASLFIGTTVWPQSPLFASAMPLWPYPLFLQNLLSPAVKTFGPPWAGVTWSLAIEEQFYLLLPLAVRRFSSKKLLIFVILCVCGAPILRTIFILKGAQFEQIHPLLPTRADGLGLGVLVAIIYRSEAAVSYIRRHSAMLYSLGLALLAVVASFMKWENWRFIGTIGYTAVDMLYAVVLISVLVLPNPRVQTLLNWRWLRWLGTISYCVYLVHEPVRAALFDRWSPGGLVHDPFTFGLTCLGLMITLSIAQVSWILIEKPLLRRAHLRYQYEGWDKVVAHSADLQDVALKSS